MQGCTNQGIHNRVPFFLLVAMIAIVFLKVPITLSEYDFVKVKYDM